MLEEGVGSLEDKLPILLVLNKKDLIKPGEIAKRLQVALKKHFPLVDVGNVCDYTLKVQKF